MTLLLRFIRELAIVMMIMFAFNAYGMSDNQQRNRLRSTCRAALHSHYENVTANASAAGTCCSACGYAGLAINPELHTADWAAFQEYGLGTCSEYLQQEVPVEEFRLPGTDLTVFQVLPSPSPYPLPNRLPGTALTLTLPLTQPSSRY